MKTKPLFYCSWPHSAANAAADDVPNLSSSRVSGDAGSLALCDCHGRRGSRATPNFAKDLSRNAARSRWDLVTIASSADKNFQKYLKTNEPQDGYSITNIEWSEKVGATKVTISKDGSTATLSFNEALLRQPLASAQNVPQPQPPGVQPPPVNTVQPPPPNVQKPMPVPSLPTPPPRVRGVIPRNPVPNTTPYPITPLVTPNAAEPEL